MKVKFTHWYNMVTAMLLSLLGFSACDDEDSNDICLYGTPTVGYIIKGKVTDTEGKPINGVKVEASEVYSSSRYHVGEPLFTDKNGEFSAEATGHGLLDGKGNIQLELTFEDVDGEENGGTFANDTIRGKDLTIKKIEEGHGAWYSGKYEVTANKALKKK